jgi:endoglucanase
MNEPNQQTAAQWYAGAVAAIKAIRAVGDTQLILIPVKSWAGSHSWNSSSNAAVILSFVN